MSSVQGAVFGDVFAGGRTTGQTVGSIIGAAIGAVSGGPMGAVYGYQAGLAIGGALDPPKGPTVEGPRLNDLTVQTSTYGQFIPRTYGTIGLSGNVFWLEKNKLKEVVKKKKSGGKGGGGSKTTVKTYTYFATFAVGLCEGPIAGVRRIWVGPDLVYDAGSDDLETIISSNQASAKFTIYTGTDTQQPDPRIQAEMGVSNCPAFRGLAYVVVKDLALADYGNSVAGAQIKVEVVNSLSVSGAQLKTTTQFPGNIEFMKAVSLYCSGSGELGIYRSNVGLYYSGLCVKTTAALGGNAVKTSSVAEPAGNQYTRGWSDRDECFIWDNSGNIYSIKKNAAELVASSALSVRAGQSLFELHRRGNDLCMLSQHNVLTPNSSFIVDLSSGSDTLISTTDSFSVDGRVAAIFLGESKNYSITSKPNIVCYDKNWNKLWSISVYGIIPSPGHAVQDYRTAIRERSDGEVVISSRGNSFFLANKDGVTALGSTLGVPSIDMTGGDHLLWPLWIRYNAQQDNIEATMLVANNSQSVPLSAIVATEAARSALIKSYDIDATGLADSVTGFKVTATGSIRNAIEPLRGAWPFDVVQAGYKIKATSRGSASVVTIPVGELAIDTQLTESREMDSQLPQNVTVKYIDRDRDYDANEQRAQRDNTEAVNSLVLELPVVLSATQSAQVADKLIRIYALEKSDFSFTLPAPYRYLEPGDVVTIATSDASYVLRLVSVNHTADGRLECAGRPSSAATYTSIAPGDGGQQGSVTIPLAGATVGLIVDCPVIDEGLQDAPGFAVGMNGYSTGWPGGILYLTADGGQTWDDLQALDGRATAGYAAGVLSVSAGNLIQRGGSITVSLIGGTLESVTEPQMLNGANIAAYGVNGRWEIIRFQNATLNGDGTYTIDTFWRGDKGTEWATGLHAANDYFVLMTDPDLAFVGMPTDNIGQPRDYRAITAGADIDSAASQTFTYAGVNLETLSGVHPRGSRSAGDLTINWQRRTRVGGAWRDYVDASLGEATESYEVDIMQGATVKRTLATSTPSVLYTSAMQVTDFGSNQSSVTVKIYQLSSVVGRGYPLETTL